MNKKILVASLLASILVLMPGIGSAEIKALWVCQEGSCTYDELNSNPFNNTIMIVDNLPSEGALIEQYMRDPDIKVYFHLSHGNDVSATPYFAAAYSDAYPWPNLHNALQDRMPPAISIMIHCGDSLHQVGHWRYEATKNQLIATSAVRSWYDTTDSDVLYEAPAVVHNSIPGKGFYVGLKSGLTVYEAYRAPGPGGQYTMSGEPNMRYPQFAGDINRDFVTNYTDLDILYAYVATYNASLIHGTWDADVTGDGAINVMDIVLLINHLGLPNDPAYNLRPRGW